jgi:hypothetical protein
MRSRLSTMKFALFGAGCFAVIMIIGQPSNAIACERLPKAIELIHASPSASARIIIRGSRTIRANISSISKINGLNDAIYGIRITAANIAARPIDDAGISMIMNGITGLNGIKIVGESDIAEISNVIACTGGRIDDVRAASKTPDDAIADGPSDSSP